MRTLIRGGWVVGFSEDHHTLVPNGVVVIEDDRILFVGRQFDGSVDREIDARDKLVSPGFIDTHVHAGHRATHRLITDTGRREFFGQPFLEFTIPRAGTAVRGDNRYVKPTDPSAAVEANQFFAQYTIVDLLRNGTTTFFEITSQPAIQEQLARAVEQLGLRAYLGPGYNSGRWVGDENGRLKRMPDDAGGWQGLEAAKTFIRKFDGSARGRIRGLLCPDATDLCNFDLIQSTRDAADELGAPIQIHASYSVREFYQVVTEQGVTPIEWLARAGILRPGTSIGHGNLVAENRLMNYSGGRDLELLASTGTVVAHCPVNLVRRARYIEWERYRKAGVTMALGTDTYPRDMVMQMRTASYFGKVISGNLFAAPAAEVFEAATLGGARALQRDDLGRLAPGAKADVVLIRMTGQNNLRWGAVRDPIKSLVECGVADDVDTVIVDGVVRMERGQIPGVDVPALCAKVQAVAEDIWSTVQEWDPLSRTAEEMSPWSFPLTT
jgi:5-methylthioadenosine/S-adenosylhomocysteine deaminase